MDSILPLITALFILSMISERIVNFIKLQFSNKKFLGIQLKNLKDASLISDVEDARTKRILVLNIIIGTFVAVGMRADLIAMMKNLQNPSQGIGWSKNLTMADWLTLPVGCLLTGCFLSLGSKFWHDLLDLVMQVKDLKRTLVQQNMTTDSGQAAGAGTSKTNYKAQGLATAHLAIQDNSQTLTGHFSNISKLLPCFDEENGTRIPCVDICLDDQNTAQIPGFLPFTNGDGSVGSVKVRLIKDFKPVRPQAGTGDVVFNQNTPAVPGTLGCLVTGKDPNVVFALTCNHVLTGRQFQNPGSLGDETQENLGAGPIDLGAWTAGVMDKTVDAALITLTDPTNGQPNGLASGSELTLQESDAGTPVTINSSVSPQKTGFVIHVNKPFTVNYDNQSVDMQGLISISSTTNAGAFSRITMDGDSGSLVFHTEKQQPIGIVLGANDQFTYVIPMAAIKAAFKDFQLTILP
jgi:hypothetical protein